MSESAADLGASLIGAVFVACDLVAAEVQVLVFADNPADGELVITLTGHAEL